MSPGTMDPCLLATGSLHGDGWRQLGELGLAFVLSAVIGLERELRQKDAGLRTHTLVGVGAALFMLVSKYGFADVLEPGRIVLDPSRVAAQIVTGIGFLGAGLIFVRGNGVRGLTTAASVWVTAAIASAAAAGLPVLAAAATGLYFVATLLLTLVSHRVPAPAAGPAMLRVRYLGKDGVLRQLLQTVTEGGFVVDRLSTERGRSASGADLAHGAVVADGAPSTGPDVEVKFRVRGQRPVRELVATLSELPGVESVAVEDFDRPEDASE